MIAKMKKITLLCVDSERAETLERLQAMGLLHLEVAERVAAVDLAKAREELAAVSHAMRALAAADDVDAAAPATIDGAELLALVTEKLAAQQQARDSRETLKTEAERISPFGDFDPAAVAALEQQGIVVRLYRAPRKVQPVAPEGATLSVLHEDAAMRSFAVFGTQVFDVPDSHEVALPERPLSAIQAEITALTNKEEQVAGELASLKSAVPALERYAEQLQDTIDYQVARESMSASGHIAYLRGYGPADRMDALREAAANHGWALLAEDPADDDPAPTLVRNPVWIRPIKAVFDVIGILPGYREIDISAVFLLFFSVFFAMLVGDAGYGIIFLLATLAARFKMKKAPAYPFHLLGVLSVCTIIWGTLTGNYFGITGLPAPLQGCTVEWLTKDSNVMRLCFLIGAIHLTIAHAWNCVRVINSTRALAEAGWILITWTMYFTACTMILDSPFPGWGLYLLGAGLALVVLFMTPPRAFKKEWHGHVMLPLDVIGNFVDVVSYVRLFAVGAASLAVAVSFNEMAIGKGINSVTAGIVAALILFFGHLLNIVLAAMGILVHGVRLNTLEFSSHIGMQWSGVPYNPFSKRIQTKDKS